CPRAYSRQYAPVSVVPESHADPPHTLLLYRCPIQVRQGRRSHDRTLEPEPLGLLEPRPDPLHAAQLATQTQLSDEHGPRVRGPIAQRGGDGDREAEVRGGLADAKTADEVHVYVMAPGREARALCEHGEEQQHALRVGTVHRPSRQPEARRRHERLDLDEKRPRALDGRDDDAAGDTAAALLEKDLRRIGDL